MTQLGRMTPGAKAVVAELMSQWQAQIAAGITRMMAAGELPADLDANRTAAAILAGIQGGVVMLMSTGDLTPLEAALDLAIGYLGRRGQVGDQVHRLARPPGRTAASTTRAGRGRPREVRSRLDHGDGPRAG